MLRQDLTKNIAVLVPTLLMICSCRPLYLGENSSDKINPATLYLQVNEAFKPATLYTTVSLVADEEITPKSNELVTFGLPIAKDTLSNIENINVSINGIEQPVCIEQTMTWWDNNTIRAVKIQLTNVDMTTGNIQLVVTDRGRTTANDLACQPVTNGWTIADAEKSHELYPRVFPQHDLNYLAVSGIIPPFLPAPKAQDGYEDLTVGQVERWSGALNFDNSSKGNWLFDRSTAYFKNYMTTGRIRFLKEAILSKQFYFQFVRNDGSPPAQAGGDGCWQFNGVACADGKYIAPQQAKLALALLGDDTQWKNSLIINMAKQADLGWNQYSCSGPAPTDQNFGFTERSCGLTGLSQLIAYEMTGDKSVLLTMNKIIGYLQSIQQSEFVWDTENGWTPKSGAFTHDIDVHEGNYSVSSAPENYTDGQGFSPWMNENIADFLWQVYWITENPEIPQILLRLGNAIDLHGFTSIFNEEKGKHDRLAIYGSRSRAQGCNRERIDTELLYFGSAYASEERRIHQNSWRWYTDNHNIEVVLPLAVAYYFENNVTHKRRLKRRIDKIVYGWAYSGCASVFGNTYRLFNWQHRSNAMRTWDWIRNL